MRQELHSFRQYLLSCPDDKVLSSQEFQVLIAPEALTWGHMSELTPNNTLEHFLCR